MTDWNIVGIEMRIQRLDEEKAEQDRSIHDLWEENRALRRRIEGLENIVTAHERYLAESNTILKVEAAV